MPHPLTPAPDTERPYAPPPPTGGRCPGCGRLVLICEYREGVYVALAAPVSSVLGHEHHCLTHEKE